MTTAILQDTVLTALVVDDDPFSQQLLSEMLAQDGLFLVDCATDGQHALRVLAEMTAPPDLLICDVYMPNMDGIEFLHELGRQGYAGDIVLLTGVNEQVLGAARAIAVARGLQVKGAFTKPVAYAQLMRAIAPNARPPERVN
jgi:CheY-like chemotaxis protein